MAEGSVKDTNLRQCNVWSPVGDLVLCNYNTVELTASSLLNKINLLTNTKKYAECQLLLSRTKQELLKEVYHVIPVDSFFHDIPETFGVFAALTRIHCDYLLAERLVQESVSWLTRLAGSMNNIDLSNPPPHLQPHITSCRHLLAQLFAQHEKLSSQLRDACRHAMKLQNEISSVPPTSLTLTPGSVEYDSAISLGAVRSTLDNHCTALKRSVARLDRIGETAAAAQVPVRTLERLKQNQLETVLYHDKQILDTLGVLGESAKTREDLQSRFNSRVEVEKRVLSFVVELRHRWKICLESQAIGDILHNFCCACEHLKPPVHYLSNGVREAECNSEGYSRSSAKIVLQHLGETAVSKLPATPLNCGREPNVALYMDDGTKVCVKGRPGRPRFVAGEILSYYMGHLLDMDNLPPVKIADRSQFSSDFKGPPKIIQIINRGQPALFVKWIDGIQSGALMPEEILDAYASNVSVSRQTLSEKSTPLSSQRNLAMWGDLIVFDYINGNHDRIASMQEGNLKMMHEPIRNVHLDATGKLWILDNESGFLDAYGLLYSSTDEEEDVGFLKKKLQSGRLDGKTVRRPQSLEVELPEIRQQRATVPDERLSSLRKELDSCREESDRLRAENEALRARLDELQLARHSATAMTDHQYISKSERHDSTDDFTPSGDKPVAAQTEMTSEQAATVQAYAEGYWKHRARLKKVLDSMADLRELEELKAKILLSILVLAHRQCVTHLSAQFAQLDDQLGVEAQNRKADTALHRAFRDALLRSFLHGGSTSHVDGVAEVVLQRVSSTLAEYPQLHACPSLTEYAQRTSRLAWQLILTAGVFSLDHDVRQPFSSVRHWPSQSSGSTENGAKLRAFLWPTLLLDGVPVYRGIVSV